MMNTAIRHVPYPAFSLSALQPLRTAYMPTPVRRDEHIQAMRTALNVPYNPFLPPAAQSLIENSLDWYGKSSLHGPDRGNLACASMVNEVLSAALNKKYGVDPETVNSVRDDLLRQGGRVIDPRYAQGGDLALTFNNAALRGIGGGTAHIGILLDQNRVLSNSSSRARFDAIEPVSTFATKYPHFEIIRPVEALTGGLPSSRLTWLA